MTQTAALAPDPQTPLAKIVAASTPPREHSGFRLMPLGVYSLDARLELAKRARRSLDLQYYVIENDGAGGLLLRALNEAAQRGVRVRLLVDDLYTAHTDQLLLALSTTPNIEVRLFNPFCCARGGLGERFVASAFDIPRLNHRMHNKLLIADGAFAVVGGRNIADEYFVLNDAQNFIDMDALVVGKVIPQLEGIFDDYWNSEEVYPVADIVQPQRGHAAMTEEFDTRVGMAPRRPPKVILPSTDVLGYGPIGEELDDGRIGLLWGPANAVADPPAKLRSMTSDEAFATSVTMRFWTQLLTAQSDVMLTSPYLVPGERGIEAFEELRTRNVSVTLLTNSLAANDEQLVHSGYSRYRERLLASGCDLYELSPSAHPAQPAPRYVRQIARAPACQDRGGRQAQGVHRLRQPGPTLRDGEHRTRHHGRQPAAGARTAAHHQHQQAGERLPAAAGGEQAHHRMADAGRRQGGDPARRARVDLGAAPEDRCAGARWCRRACCRGAWADQRSFICAGS